MRETVIKLGCPLNVKIISSRQVESAICFLGNKRQQTLCPVDMRCLHSPLSVLWPHLLFHPIMIYNESGGSHPVGRDPFPGVTYQIFHISEIHVTIRVSTKITVVKEQ